MIEAAICDGDWVVVRSQPDAANGEIVAAMVEDVDGASATVKVLSRRDGHQWLPPPQLQLRPDRRRPCHDHGQGGHGAAVVVGLVAELTVSPVRDRTRFHRHTVEGPPR